MNKTFKTLWNDVRRCYIVANEAQKTHGKPSKAAVVAVAVMGAFGVSGCQSAAIVESIFAYIRYACGQRNRREAFAAIESVRLDFGNARRNHQAGKKTTVYIHIMRLRQRIALRILEIDFAPCRQIRNMNFPQAIALLEIFFLKPRYVIADCKFLQ